MANVALRGTSNLINILPKRFASAAAAQNQSSSNNSSKSVSSEPLRVTKLDSGIVIASAENHAPVTRIAAVVNSGTRDETASERGASHALRVFSSLATRNYSQFGLSRHLDQIGAELGVSSSREQTSYLLESARGNTARGVDIMGEILSRPELRHWEIDDAQPRLNFDLDVYDERVDLQLVDLIHRASFANGLSNSLYAPRYNASNLNSELLQTFRARTFTADRLTLIGVGIQHDDLLRYAEFFRLPASASATADASAGRVRSRFLPTEVRQETNASTVHLALSVEGAALSAQKDVLVAALVSHAFGLPGQRVKYSSSNKLSRTLLPLAQQPASLSTFSLNYSDAGLFGFHVVADKQDAGKLTVGLVNELRNVAKAGLSAAEVSAAKNSLKFQLADAAGTSTGLIDRLSQDQSQTDLQAVVDSITAADANAFVKKVAAGPMSLAAIGDLSHLPRLADLSA